MQSRTERDMTRITLINPNTSRATTVMMTEIARKYLPENFSVEGVTATRGVSMILNGEELAASAGGVVEMGLAAEQFSNGLIVSAFGDPGLDRLKALSSLPTVGICEASMYEASAGGRRFGIATVTPDLVASFAAKAETLGLAHLFTGTRLTSGDPLVLASDPARLHAALEIAVRECLERDGAEAVIIGGGPLGQAADDLQRALSSPVIAPIRSAVELLLSRIVHPPEAGSRAN
ncbi:Hydantoin racemase [Neorhizobium galegae bv. officinalis]|uniref:Hydantoin racemase n=2 Tax=Neorhizobium galegae TaxID=399 RepID=A0A0T7G0U2_NEOGA|nr:Hydantoin racemase [Neorhizobium galegae bv. officinalis]